MRAISSVLADNTIISLIIIVQLQYTVMDSNISICVYWSACNGHPGQSIIASIGRNMLQRLLMSLRRKLIYPGDTCTYLWYRALLCIGNKVLACVAAARALLRWQTPSLSRIRCARKTFIFTFYLFSVCLGLKADFTMFRFLQLLEGR